LAGYEPHAWFEFGVGVLGAAAALSGLLFVAMSINIERILALRTLPPRAAGTWSCSHFRCS
jgi:modulator of FtsH protease